MRSTAVLLIATLITIAAHAQTMRPRAREIGLAPGILAPGPLNAINRLQPVVEG